LLAESAIGEDCQHQRLMLVCAVKKVILGALLAITCAASSVFATAQYPDYIWIDGRKAAIHSNPLEVFFGKNPGRRPQSRVSNSALWRGYIAHFEFVGGKLSVKDVTFLKWDDKKGTLSEESVMDQVFPAGADRGMDWFTGFLILPEGKVTEYVHMGYASSFERYRLILVKGGRQAADAVFSAEDYRRYKTLQFEAYSKSDHFKRMKADLEKRRGEEWSPGAEDFLSMFDVSFPMEIIIDYKDFKPSKAP
jgi:hypothetical protein